MPSLSCWDQGILIQDGDLSQQVNAGLISQPYVLLSPGWLRFPLSHSLIAVWFDKSYPLWKMLMTWWCKFQTAVHSDSASSSYDPHTKFLLIKRKLKSVLRKSDLYFFLFCWNLLPLSSHMAYLCSQVSHRKSMRLPQTTSVSFWVTEAFLLCQLRPNWLLDLIKTH